MPHEGIKAQQGLRYAMSLPVATTLSGIESFSEKAPPIGGAVSEELSRQFLQLLRWNGLDRISVKPQVRSNHFWWKMSEPVVE